MEDQYTVNKDIDATNNINSVSTTSQRIGVLLLQGWIMLESVCHICKITPLIKRKNDDARYCAECNLFIKVENNDNSNQNEKEDTNIEINDQSEDKREYINTKNEKDSNSEGTTFNNLEPSSFLENEENNNIGCTNSQVNNSIKYIKEIKLQNEEFSDILNKSNITKDEIKNLLNIKDYVKERCGYDVGKWITVNNNQEKQKKLSSEIKNINKNPNSIQKNYFKKDISMNENIMKYTYYDDTYFLTNYNKFKKESTILEKTNYVLYDKLEKYGACLEEVYEQSEEFVLINKISEIIQTLKNINDIKSRTSV